MAKEMKLLCIHPALAPYRLDFFNLLAERVELKVAFVYKNTVNQKFDQKSLLTKARFDYCYLSGFDVRGRGLRFGIGRLIRQFKPDVVMGYEASPITLWLCAWRKLSRAKWRLWTHMDEAPDTIASRKGLRRKVRDWIIRHCDGIMVPSAAAAEAYRQLIVASRQSLVVSGGAKDKRLMTNDYRLATKFAIVPIIHDTATIRANAERVIELGKEWKSQVAPNGEKILLYVGRLATVKNLYWLLEQIKSFSAPAGIVAVFVGDGPEREGLLSKTSELGLEAHVRFVGRKDGDELYAIMSAADALVLPSTFEPYGAVVAEAMQWGTPVILSDRVGAKELVNGSNGCVFDHLDPIGFENAVGKVLRHKRGTESILSVVLKDSIDELVKALDEIT